MNIKNLTDHSTIAPRTKNTKHATLTKHIILTFFTLTLLITPKTTKTALPEIQGLYNLFDPDVIGIGQALKIKGWIENVYDFAPDNNPAKEVIKILWNKLNENSNFVLSGNDPVLKITIDDFCKILNYIQTIKKDDIAIAKKTKEMIKERVEKITKDFGDFEKKRLELEKENKTFEKREKINYDKAKEKYDTFKKSGVLEKKEIKAIENGAVKASNAEKNKKIDDIANNFSNANNFKDIGKSKSRTLLKELTNLKNSDDFIPETAEAILWAFFEEKFTIAEDRENNFRACLDKLKHKEIDFTQYYPGDSVRDVEIEIEKICNIENQEEKEAAIQEIIQKLIDDKIYYDKFTYSCMKMTTLAALPTAVKPHTLKYKGIPKDGFPTCFEQALLDKMSLFIYNPKTEKYSLDMLPEKYNLETIENTSDPKYKFFKEIVSQIFTGPKTGEFIDHKNINTKMQAWIDIIEDIKGIKYNSPEIEEGLPVDPNQICYDLGTTFENLVKILDKIYNLELGIVLTKDHPEILETTFFDNKDKPKNAKDFWDKIFSYISEKLSTNKSRTEAARKVIFTCEEITKNNSEYIEPKDAKKTKTIKTKNHIGKIKVEIKYTNEKYKIFGFGFTINFQPYHAFITCTKRDSIALSAYDYYFKKLLAQKVYAEKENKKLLSLFILLTNLEIAEKTDLQIQNLLFYCMKLKNDENKFEFIKTAAIKGLFEDKIFRPTIKSFIAKILTNKSLTSNLLSAIATIEEKNQIIDEIVNAAMEKNPEELLLQICKNKPKEWTDKIAIQIMKSKPDLEISKISNDLSITYYATINNHEEIIHILLEHKKLANFDKFACYAIQGDSDKAKQYIDLIQKTELENKHISTIIFNSIEKQINEEFLKDEKIFELISKLNLYQDEKRSLIIKIARFEKLDKTSEKLLDNLLSNFDITIIQTALSNIDTKVSKNILNRAKIKNAALALNEILPNITDTTPLNIVNQLIDAVNNNEIQKNEFNNLVDNPRGYDNLLKKDLILDKYHITSKLNNEKIKKIIEELILEKPLEILFEIVKMKEINKQQEEIALKIIANNQELEISKIIERETSLTVAAGNKHLEIAKNIFHYPKATNLDKLNYFIIIGNNQEAAKRIKQASSEELNGPDKKCFTPLYYAVKYDNTEIIKQLLAKPEIDINRKYWNGETVLHVAAKKESPEIVKLLIDYPNIDINIKTNDYYDGKTPLDLAKNKEIKKMLIAKGAKTKEQLDEAEEKTEQDQGEEEVGDEELGEEFGEVDE